MIGIVAYTLMYQGVKPYLGQGSKALEPLIFVHAFRFVGFAALVPDVLDLTNLGYGKSFAMQVAYGDAITSILAVTAIITLRLKVSFAVPLVWFFNVFGSLDFLNAIGRIGLSLPDPNSVGTFGFLVFTLYLPAILVSHIALFIHLFRGVKGMTEVGNL